MKIYVDRQIPARIEKVCIRRKCDLCPTESKSMDWPKNHIYEVKDTEITITIRMKEGESYPEGGSGT